MKNKKTIFKENFLIHQVEKKSSKKTSDLAKSPILATCENLQKTFTDAKDGNADLTQLNQVVLASLCTQDLINTSELITRKNRLEETLTLCNKLLSLNIFKGLTEYKGPTISQSLAHHEKLNDWNFISKYEMGNYKTVSNFYENHFLKTSFEDFYLDAYNYAAKKVGWPTFPEPGSVEDKKANSKASGYSGPTIGPDKRSDAERKKDEAKSNKYHKYYYEYVSRKYGISTPRYRSSYPQLTTQDYLDLDSTVKKDNQGKFQSICWIKKKSEESLSKVKKQIKKLEV